MNELQWLAIIFLVSALAYRFSAPKSIRSFLHRRMTFWCLIGFALGFWFWSDRDDLIVGSIGFLVGWGYAGLRQQIKTQDLFGKDAAEALGKEAL